MEDTIRCPKCKSSQITANKKGFSGKKAVAGALLTGGIGLLAGTIGSNKIKITCLSCGNTFNAGEGLVTSKTQPTNTVSNGSLSETEALDQEILNTLSSSNLLLAVKKCKDLTGWDLFKSKNYVDDLLKKNGIKESNTSKPSSSIAIVIISSLFVFIFLILLLIPDLGFIAKFFIVIGLLFFSLFMIGGIRGFKKG